jgi:hypothetical protein
MSVGDSIMGWYLSTALREVIPLMRLLNTIVDVWNVNTPQPQVIVHEDNQSARQLAMNEAYKPRMHHLAVNYHHFCDYVNSGRIQINYIRTNEQAADILTTALPNDSFAYLRKKLCGWTTSSENESRSPRDPIQSVSQLTVSTPF